MRIIPSVIFDMRDRGDLRLPILHNKSAGLKVLVENSSCIYRKHDLSLYSMHGEVCPDVKCPLQSIQLIPPLIICLLEEISDSFMMVTWIRALSFRDLTTCANSFWINFQSLSWLVSIWQKCFFIFVGSRSRVWGLLIWSISSLTTPFHLSEDRSTVSI